MQERVNESKQVSALHENDIGSGSGTFVATSSNAKMKVYPEEVKDRLRSMMPQRMRVSRVPTSNQFMANSFENQVTIKPSDKLQK